MPVRREGNRFVVDFAELSKLWLPEEAIEEARKERFSSHAVKNYWEKKKPFFSQVGLEEFFTSILEFLDQNREASFKRGNVEVKLVEHSLRTADFAFSLTASFPPQERAVVVLSALLHDAGKATVDKSEMNRHAEYSFEIAKRIGLLNEDWDEVVKNSDPVEVERVRLGNLISYLVRYHHESTIPAVNTFTADQAGTLKKLLPYLKRADQAAAKLEIGEAKTEAEALKLVISATKNYKKQEEKAKQEEVKREVKKEKLEENRIVQFFSLIEKGINQPADRRTPAKLYGYTMTTKPLVALIKERVLEIAKGLLGTATLEELEEALKPFSLEDGKVLRPCIFRPYPNAQGRKEVFLVVNWEKVRQFASEVGKNLSPISSLERRISKAKVSLVQE